jgi:peptidoglycan/LPS O-acetylase OafA/YrhL
MPFLRRRVARIYPLYWAATAAVLAIYRLRPEWAVREKFSIEHLMLSLALWPQREFPIVAVGWSLSFEMFFYLAFAALIAVPRAWVRPLLAAWAAATLGLFLALDDPSYRLAPEGTLQLPLVASPFTLEFIAGCFIGWAVRRGAMPLAGTAAAAGVLVFVAVGGYVSAHYPFDAEYGLVRVLTFGTASALMTYGAVGLDRQGRLTAPRWITFWGDASYSTYLTHWYVLLAFARFWPWSSGASPQWTASLLAVAACGATAAVVHLAVERPLTRAAAWAARPHCTRAELTYH